MQTENDQKWSEVVILTDTLTHSERIDSGTHFLQISFIWTELLIKWTATVPKHCRLQHVATAPIGLKQCCIQLHRQICRKKYTMNLPVILIWRMFVYNTNIADRIFFYNDLSLESDMPRLFVYCQIN